MKSLPYMRLRPLLAGSAALFLAVATSIRAEASAESREADQMDTLARTEGSAKVTESLSSRFATFAGSQANAMALITGLHTGSAVNLDATVNGQTAVTTFTPPTGKLGFGEVYLSLALAQQELAKLDITQPTAAEIEAALDGGTVTTGSGTTAKTTQLAGVLTLRSERKGWGKIARSMGVKLGPVVSDLRAADQHLNDQMLESAHAEAVEHPDRMAPPAVPARPDMGAVGRPEIPTPPSLPGHR